MRNPRNPLVATWTRRTAYASLLVAIVVACSSGQTTAPIERGPQTGDVKNVLFIGNSLTYWNAMPLMVEALADSAGGVKIFTQSVVYGGASLEDHWGFGNAQAAIALGGWDVVVMQQGPSALEASRVLLLEYARRFDTEIRKVSARPALYSVWPSQDRLRDFPRVAESYSLAATEVNGIFIPVTEAWNSTWKRDPNFALYSFDQLHPTVPASYLAALVIYGTLLSKTPVGLPRRLTLRSGTGITIQQSDADLLQAAAAEAVATYGRP